MRRAHRDIEHALERRRHRRRMIGGRAVAELALRVRAPAAQRRVRHHGAARVHAHHDLGRHRLHGRGRVDHHGAGIGGLRGGVLRRRGRGRLRLSAGDEEQDGQVLLHHRSSTSRRSMRASSVRTRSAMSVNSGSCDAWPSLCAKFITRTGTRTDCPPRARARASRRTRGSRGPTSSICAQMFFGFLPPCSSGCGTLPPNSAWMHLDRRELARVLLLVLRLDVLPGDLRILRPQLAQLGAHPLALLVLVLAVEHGAG